MNEELGKEEYKKSCFVEEQFEFEEKIKDDRFGTINILQNRYNPLEKLMQKEIKSKKLYDCEKDIFQVRERMRLNHQSLLKMIDYSIKQIPRTPKKPYYIVSGYYEYIKKNLKHDLTDRKRTKTHFTPTELLTLIEDLLEVMTFLQKNDRIHGDIRPKYISLLQTTKLMDRLGDPRPPNQVQLSNLKSGKALYMSPCLFHVFMHKEKKLRHNPYKSDVFSLGMVVLECGILDCVQGVYDRERKEIDAERLMGLLNRFMERYKDCFFLKEVILWFVDLNGKERKDPKRLLKKFNECKVECFGEGVEVQVGIGESDEDILGVDRVVMEENNFTDGNYDFNFKEGGKVEVDGKGNLGFFTPQDIHGGNLGGKDNSQNIHFNESEVILEKKNNDHEINPGYIDKNFEKEENIKKFVDENLVEYMKTNLYDNNNNKKKLSNIREEEKDKNKSSIYDKNPQFEEVNLMDNQEEFEEENLMENGNEEKFDQKGNLIEYELENENHNQNEQYYDEQGNLIEYEEENLNNNKNVQYHDEQRTLIKNSEHKDQNSPKKNQTQNPNTQNPESLSQNSLSDKNNNYPDQNSLSQNQLDLSQNSNSSQNPENLHQSSNKQEQEEFDQYGDLPEGLYFDEEGEIQILEDYTKYTDENGREYIVKKSDIDGFEEGQEIYNEGAEQGNGDLSGNSAGNSGNGDFEFEGDSVGEDYHAGSGEEHSYEEGGTVRDGFVGKEISGGDNYAGNGEIFGENYNEEGVFIGNNNRQQRESGNGNYNEEGIYIDNNNGQQRESGNENYNDEGIYIDSNNVQKRESDNGNYNERRELDNVEVIDQGYKTDTEVSVINSNEEEDAGNRENNNIVYGNQENNNVDYDKNLTKFEQNNEIIDEKNKSLNYIDEENSNKRTNENKESNSIDPKINIKIIHQGNDQDLNEDDKKLSEVSLIGSNEPNFEYKEENNFNEGKLSIKNQNNNFYGKDYDYHNDEDEDNSDDDRNPGLSHESIDYEFHQNKLKRKDSKKKLNIEMKPELLKIKKGSFNRKRIDIEFSERNGNENNCYYEVEDTITELSSGSENKKNEYIMNSNIRGNFDPKKINLKKKVNVNVSELIGENLQPDLIVKEENFSYNFKIDEDDNLDNKIGNLNELSNIDIKFKSPVKFENEIEILNKSVNSQINLSEKILNNKNESAQLVGNLVENFKNEPLLNLEKKNFIEKINKQKNLTNEQNIEVIKINPNFIQNQKTSNTIKTETLNYNPKLENPNLENNLKNENIDRKINYNLREETIISKIPEKDQKVIDMKTINDYNNVKWTSNNMVMEFAYKNTKKNVLNPVSHENNLINENKKIIVVEENNIVVSGNNDSDLQKRQKNLDLKSINDYNNIKSTSNNIVMDFVNRNINQNVNNPLVIENKNITNIVNNDPVLIRENIIISTESPNKEIYNPVVDQINNLISITNEKKEIQNPVIIEGNNVITTEIKKTLNVGEINNSNFPKNIISIENQNIKVGDINNPVFLQRNIITNEFQNREINNSNPVQQQNENLVITETENVNLRQINNLGPQRNVIEIQNTNTPQNNIVMTETQNVNIKEINNPVFQRNVITTEIQNREIINQNLPQRNFISNETQNINVTQNNNEVRQINNYSQQRNINEIQNTNVRKINNPVVQRNLITTVSTETQFREINNEKIPDNSQNNLVTENNNHNFQNNLNNSGIKRIAQETNNLESFQTRRIIQNPNLNISARNVQETNNLNNSGKIFQEKKNSNNSGKIFQDPNNLNISVKNVQERNNLNNSGRIIQGTNNSENRRYIIETTNSENRRISQESNNFKKILINSENNKNIPSNKTVNVYVDKNSSKIENKLNNPNLYKISDLKNQNSYRNSKIDSKNIVLESKNQNLNSNDNFNKHIIKDYNKVKFDSNDNGGGYINKNFINQEVRVNFENRNQSLGNNQMRDNNIILESVLLNKDKISNLNKNVKKDLVNYLDKKNLQKKLEVKKNFIKMEKISEEEEANFKNSKKDYKIEKTFSEEKKLNILCSDIPIIKKFKKENKVRPKKKFYSEKVYKREEPNFEIKNVETINEERSIISKNFTTIPKKGIINSKFENTSKIPKSNVSTFSYRENYIPKNTSPLKLHKKGLTFRIFSKTSNKDHFFSNNSKIKSRVSQTMDRRVMQSRFKSKPEPRFSNISDSSSNLNEKEKNIYIFRNINNSVVRRRTEDSLVLQTPRTPSIIYKKHNEYKFNTNSKKNDFEDFNRNKSQSRSSKIIVKSNNPFSSEKEIISNVLKNKSNVYYSKREIQDGNKNKNYEINKNYLGKGETNIYYKKQDDEKDDRNKNIVLYKNYQNNNKQNSSNKYGYKVKKTQAHSTRFVLNNEKKNIIGQKNFQSKRTSNFSINDRGNNVIKNREIQISNKLLVSNPVVVKKEDKKVVRIKI